MALTCKLARTFKPPENGVVIAATTAKLEIRLKKLKENSVVFRQSKSDFQKRCDADKQVFTTFMENTMNNTPDQGVYEVMPNSWEQLTTMEYFQELRAEQCSLASAFTRNEMEIELVQKHMDFIAKEGQDIIHDSFFLEAMNFRKEAIRLETELKFKEELVCQIINSPMMVESACSRCKSIGSVPVTCQVPDCSTSNCDASIWVLDAYLASENREFKKLFGSDLKPIKCPHCDSAFDGIADLNTHMRSAHGNMH